MRVGEILCDGSTGELTISGVSLNDDPRWCAYDLSDLWADEAFRGSNRVLPTAPGRRPAVHRQDETRYLLPFAVTGWIDAADVAVDPAGVQAALRAALDVVKAACIGTPSPEGDGTRPAVYETPDAETWSQDVQTLALRKRRTVCGLWIGTLELILPNPWVVT